MAVALLNTNTMVQAAASPASSLMSVTASGTDRCAFIVIGYDSSSGMAVSAVTYGGQTCTKAGVAAASGTPQFSYVEVWYLVNPPTGSNTVSITVTGTVQDIYYNLVAFTGVNQVTPVRAGTYQTASGSATTTVTMVVSSNTSDLTLTVLNSGGPSLSGTSSNQSEDGFSSAGGYAAASDHATTAASSVTHTWTLGGATSGYSLAGFSINGDPSTPLGAYAATGTRRAPGQRGPFDRLGFLLQRKLDYTPSIAAQSISVPAGVLRFIGQAPTLAPGGATLSVPAATIRVLGAAPVLTPGGVQLHPPAATIRFIGQAPTLVSVSNIAVPAATIRLIGQAPSLSPGAVTRAIPAATVRFLGQAPTLVNAGTLVVPAATVRFLAVAPTLSPGAGTLAVPAAVIHLQGRAPTMTGGVAVVIVDDRRRRWVGGSLRHR